MKPEQKKNRKWNGPFPPSVHQLRKDKKDSAKKLGLEQKPFNESFLGQKRKMLLKRREMYLSFSLNVRFTPIAIQCINWKKVGAFSQIFAVADAAFSFLSLYL